MQIGVAWGDGIGGVVKSFTFIEALPAGQVETRPDDTVGAMCGKIGFEPDAPQRAVLESNAPLGILNCARQWGKSTVAALKAVHRAWTRGESLVLVASPTERQSGEFLRKAAEFVRRLGVKPRGDGGNALSILFPNGSRIVGLPGTEATVRGFSAVSLLMIDEAARVDDALYTALRPTRAVGGGDLWLMSTPNGKRGFFYDEWTHGDGWERISVSATDCARISGDFLEQEKASIGSESFAQEYLCEFVDNGTEWFGRSVVEAALIEDEGLKL